MSLEVEYNQYVEKCKRLRAYPLAYEIWVIKKAKRDQNKNKQEIGFDLKKSHTGNPSKGTAWSTSDGEALK
jgi:hypothetical protein